MKDAIYEIQLLILQKEALLAACSKKEKDADTENKKNYDELSFVLLSDIVSLELAVGLIQRRVPEVDTVIDSLEWQVKARKHSLKFLKGILKGNGRKHRADTPEKKERLENRIAAASNALKEFQAAIKKLKKA